MYLARSNNRNNVIPMNITIRPATVLDFPAIFSLIQEFAIFQKTPEKVTITPAQMLEAKDLFQCLVAVTDTNEIVGFASFFFAYYSWSGKALYLDDLYVQAPFRGYNIGTQLLESLINHAKAAHCKKVRWQVSKWNTPGIEFYKKMGAAIDDVEINCDLYLQEKTV